MGMKSRAQGVYRWFRPTGRSAHEVVFFAYPPYLLTWPVIVLGFLFYHASDGWTEPLGWTYVWVTITVFITLGFNISRNTTVLCAAIIGLIWFLGLWLRDAKGITLFGDIYNWFASRDMRDPREYAHILSILMAIPYVMMLIGARINSRWRITHNEFEHYSFGRADDSLARGAKRIKSEYSDLIALVICLAGDLKVYSASGNKLLRHISLIPFLPMRRKRLNYILERTAITTAAALEEAEEEEYEESEGQTTSLDN